MKCATDGEARPSLLDQVIRFSPAQLPPELKKTVNRVANECSPIGVIGALRAVNGDLKSAGRRELNRPAFSKPFGTSVKILVVKGWTHGEKSLRHSGRFQLVAVDGAVGHDLFRFSDYRGPVTRWCSVGTGGNHELTRNVCRLTGQPARMS